MIQKPSPDLIRKYINQWRQAPEMENYRFQELSIAHLFRKLCPHNTSIEEILLKVSVLNDFYSTKIFSTYPVAKRIRELDVDSRLKSGDSALVDEIAKVSIGGKSRTLYSFASKYCSHHVPEDFAIFDFYVEKLLWEYNKEDQFQDFKRAELRVYPKFLEIIKRFQIHYQLEEFTLREVDTFLWMAGKEWYPRGYGKKE